MRVTLPNLGVLGKTLSALSRSAWQFWLCVPPFAVTQGYRNRHVSIRRLWLPINVP